MSRTTSNASPGTGFRMTAARAERRWSVTLSGERDAAAGPELGGLAEMMSASGADVDFDLGGITFVDPAGWRAVHRAARVVEASGRSARILNPSQPVRHLTDLIAARRRPTVAASPAFRSAA
jgi:anti-anti-sigma regulatory factor